MKINHHIALFIILFTKISFAQFGDDNWFTIFKQSRFINDIENDANKFVDVGAGFIKTPYYYGMDDFILSGLLIGGTALSLTFDDDIRDVVSTNHNRTMNGITYIGEKLGNAKYGMFLSSTLYLCGHFTGKNAIRETGQILAEAMLYNGIVTTGLKYILSRSRPFTNEGNFEIEAFELKKEDQYHSLPSGHTSSAFAIATVLSERIDNIYASMFFYSFAGLTAYQRIYDDRHWFSDTVLGAALGTLIGLKIVKLHEKYSHSDNNGYSIEVYPLISRSNTGIGLQLNF